MAIDVQPSGGGMLIVIGLGLTLAIWLFTSGAVSTLLLIGAVLGILLFLFWAGARRLTRRLVGM